MYKHPLPRLSDEHLKMLANVQPFANMAELDEWIESCKIPRQTPSEPGVLTEEQWQQDRALGLKVGSGHWPRTP